MADDTQQRGGQDRTRINVNQEHELRYWTERFGVSADALRTRGRRSRRAGRQGRGVPDARPFEGLIRTLAPGLGRIEPAARCVLAGDRPQPKILMNRPARSSPAATADRQRELQRSRTARTPLRRRSRRSSGAVQAGARAHPEKMPAQHLDKTGRESDLALRPQFLAPDYEGSRQAARHGGADHRWRFRHRPRGRGAVRARRCRRRHRLPRVPRRRRGDEALRRGRGPALPAAARRRQGRRLLPRFGRADAARVRPPRRARQQRRLPGTRASRIQDLSEERFRETLETNVLGYFHMAKAAVPHLKKGASIINTGSVTGSRRQFAPARLFGDQGGHPCLHQVAGVQPDGQGHPRQRGRPGTRLDAAEPGRCARPTRWRSSARRPT